MTSYTMRPYMLRKAWLWAEAGEGFVILPDDAGAATQMRHWSQCLISY